MTFARLPQLVWHRTDGTSVEFELDGESLLVGRGDEVDIRIDEPLVSREHARLERREAGYRVVDLGSTNLTKVNGDVVHQRFLSSGDEVRFARARCVFVEPESRAPAVKAEVAAVAVLAESTASAGKPDGAASDGKAEGAATEVKAEGAE